MPIFEYVCQDCGHPFETLVRSDTVPACPLCHSQRLDKVLSVFATTSSVPDIHMPPPGGCGGCAKASAPGGCPMLE